MDNNFVKVGKWGECLWGVNDNGELFINEGQADSVDYGDSPWEEVSSSILAASTIGEITFPGGASLAGLFKGCKNMEKADLSGFITANVVDMSSMFEGCINLKELDISSFDTGSCKDMRRMFGQCAKLDDMLLGQNFSTTGDGSTSCGKLAVKEYGKYKKAKTISVEGFRVFYHSNYENEDIVEEKHTVPNYRYMIEDPMFKAPGERSAFVAWNTEPDAKGRSYLPGRAIDEVDEDLDLYAIWAWAPVIKDVAQPRAFTFGETIPFELPEIISINDPEVSGYLEISKNGEEGTWHAIDHSTVLPVSFNGYLIRLHASNSVGETVSNAVRLYIRKASMDMSSIRWVEEDSMVYDGRPKQVHVEGIPAGIEARYENNIATEAGTYIASIDVDFDKDNFNDPIVVKEHEWTIRKAPLDMSAVRWNYSSAFTYDGSTRSVELTGLPEGVTAVYENNVASDAGLYTATARLEYDTRNFERPADIIPCVWEIKKAVIDPGKLSWSEYRSFVYDGSPKNVYLLNLPEDAVVEYDGAEETLAGKYLARASLVGNYCLSGPAEYEWEIAKETYDLSKLKWTETRAFSYDGEPHGIILSGIPEALHIRYSGNVGVAAGKYMARGIFINPDTHNYVTPDDVAMEWQIKKQVVDMSAVRWDYERPFTYDGEAKTVRLLGLPECVKAEYESNMAFNAGEYNAHAILRYDSDNLEVDMPADCQWKINRRRIDVSGAYWDYTDAYTYDGTEHGVYLAGLPEGLEVEYSENRKIETGTYVASATMIPTDRNNYEVPEINGCTWAIKKADRTLDAVSWTDDREFVYDGREKKVEIITELDDSILVDYEANTEINAGRYYSKAIFSLVDGTNFNAPKPVGHAWSIAKAHHDMSRVVWDYEGEFTYDGSEKSVHLLNVPDGVIVTYRNESARDAGNYTAVASFEVQDSNNYVTDIPDMTLEWSVRKAVFDLSKVRWQGEKEYLYDGEEKGTELKLIGLPDGLIPVYTDSTATAAGRYTAKAAFRYDENNYEQPEVAPCHWIIEKSPMDLSNVSWDYDKPFVYDGSEKRVTVSELPEGSHVEYSNAGAIQAGTYVAAAEIVPNDLENRVKGRLDNLTWRIERGEYDMSHAKWDYDKPFVYDGTEHRAVLKGLPEGVTPMYRGNSAVDAGKYRASVTFSIADEHNYNVPEMGDFEWEISKADYDMSGAYWDYEGEYTYTGSMYEVSLRGLPEGVRAVYTGNAAANTGKYVASADLIPFDQDNYNKPSIPDCSWRIVKADCEMSAVRWDYTDAKVYNGREQGVMLEHLPNGVTATYDGNEATDVGKYTASAVLVVSDPANYNVPSVSDCDWEITRAEYDLSGLTWDYRDGKFVYDGDLKKVELTNMPKGLIASYKGNTATLAGEYTAVALFDTEDFNYEAPDSISIPWRIERTDYDMSKVEWNYRNSFIYDGSPKRVELIGLPAGISVDYMNNVATNAGVYTACAHFSSETDNYNVPGDLFCTWSIDKADIDIRRVAWGYSQSFIYDGTIKKVELRNVPDLLEVRYSGNTAEVAGKYLAHAELVPVNPENYNVPVMRDCVWAIDKADYDMSDARWDGEFEFTYDGGEKGVYITGLPHGVTPVYHDNTAVSAGSYTARADLVCDADNFNVPAIGECRWSIRKANYDMTNASWYAEDKIVYDGSVKSVKLRGLPEGLTPIYRGNTAVDAGDYEASVDFSYDERNFNKPSFGGCKWHIAPAEIDVDLSMIRWNYTEPFVYDGTVKTISILEYEQEQGLFDKLRGRKAELELSGIPEGFDVIYSNNTAVNAGVYYASAKLVSREDNGNYNELVLPQFRWEIAKARVDMTGVRWNYGEAFVYDGEEKSVELIGLPDTVEVAYTDNTGVFAGEHEALAAVTVTDPDNYEQPGPVSGCWWQIDKAVYDMSQVRWTYDEDIVYNGKEKSIRVVGLPEGVKVESYRGNKGIEAGLYTAEAVIKYRNKENYEEPTIPVQKWRIRKKKIDTSDISWSYDDNTGFVYDDKPKEVRLIGVPDDVEVVYVDNNKINAGTYTAKARLVYDTRNCEVDDVPDLRWKIDKATYDTRGVHWTYEKPFVYDGSEKSISLVGVPKSIAVRYRDNKASAMGTYTAKAYLTYDNDNYEAPKIETTIDWAIVGKEVE